MLDHTKISKFIEFQNVWANTDWLAGFKEIVKIRENVWFWGRCPQTPYILSYFCDF
jgi:hypothetical protein